MKIAGKIRLGFLHTENLHSNVHDCTHWSWRKIKRLHLIRNTILLNELFAYANFDSNRLNLDRTIGEQQNDSAYEKSTSLVFSSDCFVVSSTRDAKIFINRIQMIGRNSMRSICQDANVGGTQSRQRLTLHQNDSHRWLNRHLKCARNIASIAWTCARNAIRSLKWRTADWAANFKGDNKMKNTDN